MKLDRNLNANKRGKYALLKLRKLDDFTSPGDPFQEVAVGGKPSSWKFARSHPRP